MGNSKTGVLAGLVLLGIPWPALRGPLRNHFCKKRRPQPYWGGTILEMLWKPQMPWIIGLGASQPYSRREFQEKLWERFRRLSGIFPNFFRKVPAVLGVQGPIKGSPVFTRPFFLFAPFAGHPSSSPFLGTFSPFSPLESALICRAKGTVQSLERGSSGMDLLHKVREGNSFPKSAWKRAYKRDPKRDKLSQIRSFLLEFADFCRFFAFPGNYSSAKPQIRFCNHIFVNGKGFSWSLRPEKWRIRANRFARLSANHPIHANRKFEWFVRIGLTRYKNRGFFNCGMIRANRFARSRCESPVPLSALSLTAREREQWFFSIWVIPSCEIRKKSIARNTLSMHDTLVGTWMLSCTV